MINKLTIIGVGLIGGSLAKALRAAGKVGEIVGYGRSLGNLQLAQELGVIDRVAVNPADAVLEADVVVLAVPVGNLHELLESIASSIPDSAVVTDVGSVKSGVVADARRLLGSRFPRFVPGHPLAGTEQSGVGASIEDLFQGRRVVLTPAPETDASAIARVRALWQVAGAEVVIMTAEDHDRVVAASSHLPHALAFTMMDMIVRRDDHRTVLDCAAGGFRDFTRIAGSDPIMWRDICLANRSALLEVARQYQAELGELLKAIENGDGEWLRATFARAKHARDSLNLNTKI
jgi:prephenate dehydrogenase